MISWGWKKTTTKTNGEKTRKTWYVRDEFCRELTCCLVRLLNGLMMFMLKQQELSNRPELTRN